MNAPTNKARPPSAAPAIEPPMMSGASTTETTRKSKSRFRVVVVGEEERNERIPGRRIALSTLYYKVSFIPKFVRLGVAKQRCCYGQFLPGTVSVAANALSLWEDFI